MTTYKRFIALGDSLTEGLSDKYPNGGYRGWADRVADGIASQVENFEYANLAVRGKLLEQVVGDQLEKALPLIQGSSTVVSFHAGANNILRPKLDLDALIASYQSAVRTLTATGARVLVFTVREVSNPKSKTEVYWNERFGPFNNNVRAVAAETGAVLMDANSREVFGDPRMLANDRLHLSSEGHRRVAAAVLAELGLPHDSDFADEMPPHKKSPAPFRVVGTVVWGVGFLVPWAIRRITGKSSGDGRIAKYPELITWPASN